MTAVIASAPGKVVLLGEYAVLEGAPSVVAAISARAQVSVREAASYSLSSSLLPKAQAFVWQPGQPPQWPDTVPADLADWLSQLLLGIVQALGTHPAPFHLDLDTHQFFSAETKLGLGSSSALAVALHGAMARFCGQSLEMDSAFAAHRAVQQGQGSGIDVATALHGGVLGFRRVSRSMPRVSPYAWPDSLSLTVVFAGHSTATGSAVQRYRYWRQSAGAKGDAIWQDLASIAGEGEKSLKSGDCVGTMSALADYAQGLERLGQAAGIDIVSPIHQQLGQRVAAFGPAVYKPSGAGGGDVGVALCARDDAADLREHLRRGGCRVLNLSIDPQGLEFE